MSNGFRGGDHGTHPRAPHFFMSIEMYHRSCTATVCTAGEVIYPKPVSASAELAHAVSWALTSRARCPWPFPSVDIAARSQSHSSPVPESGCDFPTALTLRRYGPRGLWAVSDFIGICAFLSRGGMDGLVRRGEVYGLQIIESYRLQRSGNMAMGRFTVAFGSTA